MSGNDYTLFWAETVRQLMEEGNLSEQEHDMWFRNMSFSHYENNSLILDVPSNFYRDQVKQRYLDLLKSKLHELSGSFMEIQFEIKKNPESSRTNPAEIPDEAANDKENVKPEPPAKDREPHNQLRLDYDFDGFVIGNNNSFAASAAQAIASNPGEAYNPFLIYGGVGLGKTHLMQAIGNMIHYTIPEKRVVYITAETFVNEFIQSIRSETQSQFKNKYRKVDVLLIDDIHDLQNKKETQEELFHTFNALYDTKKQLVFTCDRPPFRAQKTLPTD